MRYFIRTSETSYLILTKGVQLDLCVNGYYHIVGDRHRINITDISCTYCIAISAILKKNEHY